jgi:hypothetical protein
MSSCRVPLLVVGILSGLVTLGLAGASCSSDTYSFPTSVQGSSVLAALSNSDRIQLCADTNNYTDKQVARHQVQDLDCRYGGLVAASAPTVGEGDVQSSCTQAFDACIVLQVIPSLPGTVCAPPTATCSATVTEYGACLADYFQWAVHRLAALPVCSTLTRAKLDALASAPVPQMPASCGTFAAKCPDSSLIAGLSALFGGMSSASEPGDGGEID